MSAGSAPRGVRVISVVHFLLAGFWALVAVACVFGALTGGTSGGWIKISWTFFALASVVCAGISGGLGAVGYGLFEGRSWARRTAIGLSALAVLAGLGFGFGVGDVVNGVLLNGLWGSGWISVLVHGGVVGYLSLSEDVAGYFR